MQAADRAGVVGQQRFKVLKALWRSENVRRGIESQVCSAGSQGPGCELRTRQCVGCGTSGRDSNRCDRSEHLDNAAVGENQISRFGRAAEAVIESNFSTHNNEQLGAQPRIGWEAGIRTPIPWSRERCLDDGRLRSAPFCSGSLDPLFGLLSSVLLRSRAMCLNVSHPSWPRRHPRVAGRRGHAFEVPILRFSSVF